jgi:hypothetical protein
VGFFQRNWRLLKKLVGKGGDPSVKTQQPQSNKQIGASPAVATEPRGSRAPEPADKRRLPLRQKKPVVICGCDFGTHSTKILYQRRGSNSEVRLPKLEPATAGYPTYAIPSAVRLVDGRLYFGGQALKESGGELFTGFKWDLLNLDATVPVSHYEPTSPAVVAVAYLAWLFRRLAEVVRQSYPNADVRVQLPVPLDVMGRAKREQLEKRFFQVVQAAWKISLATRLHDLSNDFAATPMLKKIFPGIITLLAEPLIDEGERLFDVLPEAISPIVALSMDPDRDPGVHLLVDTGDGTTEISVIDIKPAGGEDKISCYFNTSVPIGAAKLRQSECGDGQGDPAILEALDKECRVSFFRGYSKVKDNHLARRNWNQISLVLTGGGTLRTDIRQTFGDGQDSTLYSAFRQYHFSHNLVDGSWIDLGKIEPRVPAGETRFYVGARGLLVERPMWPIWFAPDEIEAPVATPRAAAVRPYWEQ